MGGRPGHGDSAMNQAQVRKLWLALQDARDNLDVARDRYNQTTAAFEGATRSLQDAGRDLEIAMVQAAEAENDYLAAAREWVQETMVTI